MIITLLPADALALIERANAVGVVHHFIQTSNTVPGELALEWMPKTDVPPVAILLKADGSWRATYDMGD